MNKKPLLALFGTILLLLGGYVFLRHSSNPPGSLPNTGNSAGLSPRQQSLLQQPALPPGSEIAKLVVRKAEREMMPTMRKATC